MQAALPLPGAFDMGPLFAPPVKRRPPKRPPGDTVMAGRMRRAAERRATPAWADAAATRAMFKRAKELTAATGVVYSVDHIVPLQHPLVCGLHWAGNMRVATLDENMRKGNRSWPDAWEGRLSATPATPVLPHSATPPKCLFLFTFSLLG